MCGIAGFTGPANDDVLATMTRLIRHRGPDAEGFHTEPGINLGNRRLRVIDVEGGDQPIANEDRSIWIVYNGEVYNADELRADLERRGHVFRTKSDTEVLVHLYEEHGETFARHLNGIFAFAIWDSRRQRLLLGRDPVGVKPLHYTEVAGELVFGSEIKALLAFPGVRRELNENALHLFLNLRYVPHEQTLFRNILRLAPGHVLVRERGATRIVRYWDPTCPIDHESSPEELADGLRERLRTAVKRQLVSDVPLGVYLSGGLDSSTLLAFAAAERPGIHTFSLGFGEPTDELDDAAFVARHFGTTHHALTVQAEPLARLPEVLWHTEEPKENVLQGYLLAEHGRKHVTVALSGLGGDELFAGYQIHRYVAAGQKLHAPVPGFLQRAFLAPVSRGLFAMQNATGTLHLDHYRRGMQLLLASGDRTRFYGILRNVWDHDAGQWKIIYGERMRNADLPAVSQELGRYFADGTRTYLEQVLEAEFHTKMVEDFLNNEDRVSMAHGLEVRVPFLDPDVVAFARAIPGRYKFREGKGKWILRRAMEGLLPPETMRKKKWGFTFSSYHQFRKDLRTTADRILTRHRVESMGLFNYDYLRRIMDHPPTPRMYWHYFYLWNVLAFTIWHRMFLEQPIASTPELSVDAYAQ